MCAIAASSSNRIASSPAVIDGATFIRVTEYTHELAAATHGANRETTADRFRHGRQIGLETVVALRAADGMTQGDHLIADKDDARACGFLAQYRKELGVAGNYATGAKDRLDDNSREFVAVTRHGFTHRLGIVVTHEYDVVRCRGRQTGKIRGRYGNFNGVVRRRHGVATDHDEIVRTMIGAFELADTIAPGIRARDPQRHHHRFGAGIVEYDLLDAADPIAQMCDEFVLLRTGCRVTRAACELLLDRRPDPRMAVAVNHRRVIVVEVDARIAVEIRTADTLGASHVKRKRLMFQ